MGHLHATGRWCAALGSALVIAAPASRAQPAETPGGPVQAQLDALQQQLTQQQEAVEQLRRQLGEQELRYRQLLQQVDATHPAPDAVARTASDAPRTVQVGTAPETQPAPVAQIFDQPGVLTPRGRFVLEPSLQYGYSSSNRAALVGFTVIPALLIGLIDVREVRRNTVTAGLAVRYGLSNRAELEARVPYVHRSDSTVSREIFTGTANESVFQASGNHIGDVEVTGRYQLTDGSGRLPYLIASLRVKSRTGRDPFDVITDCVTRCVGNTTGTGQPLDLPTGSGFYSLQPALTWLYPSDPAVFFGSFTYVRNFKRSNISRHVLGGETEFVGEVKAGDAIGFNVGMGLALNERSSFSIGVDVSSIGRTRQNGVPIAGSVRTQLASLVLGYSHVWDAQRTINLAVGAGLTRDTPDVTLTLRIPFML
jgi:hypothetical protein